jgi:hypothetical protein
MVDGQVRLRDCQMLLQGCNQNLSLQEVESPPEADTEVDMEVVMEADMAVAKHKLSKSLK